jgi:hypothetical protein
MNDDWSRMDCILARGPSTPSNFEAFDKSESFMPIIGHNVRLRPTDRSKSCRVTLALIARTIPTGEVNAFSWEKI